MLVLKRIAVRVTLIHVFLAVVLQVWAHLGVAMQPVGSVVTSAPEPGEVIFADCKPQEMT